MISEELLSEVLGYEVEWFKIEDNKLSFRLTFSEEGAINIYELAHKCKKWARTKGYQIWSGHQCRGDIFACSVYVKDDYANDDDFEADTEPEAIFKTCEWVRENIE